MADTPKTSGWALANIPRPDYQVPQYGLIGGKRAPYDNSQAQLLDTMMMSGLLPGGAPNALLGNKAGRFSFGGGGGYGGMYGLLGGTSAPGGYNPQNPVNPGVNGPGGYYNPQAPGGGAGGPRPGTPIVTDGPGFTGNQNPNPGVTPGTPGGNPGDPAAFAALAQGYAKPTTPPTATQEQLAQIAALGGPQAYAAQQQLYSQLGPQSYAQMMNAIEAPGNATMYNPSRQAAVSQLARGMTPQQVFDNPQFGAAGGNYYNLDGTSTGLNPGAAPSTSPGTSLSYLQQIAALLGPQQGSGLLGATRG